MAIASAQTPADDNLIKNLASAPEIYVEGYRGVSTRAGVVKLNFFTQRFDPSSNILEKFGAATLAMPLADFVEIIKGLNALAQDMRENGILPKEDAQ